MQHCMKAGKLAGNIHDALQALLLLRIIEMPNRAVYWASQRMCLATTGRHVARCSQALGAFRTVSKSPSVMTKC
jgi:hypothetical protein